MERNFSKKQ
ncbi:hypothetical protein AYI69_g6969, partial [Smittium culicis]